MATEIIEFCVTPVRYGGTVPQRVLPPLRNTVLAIGSTWTVGADTVNILITPDEDVRLAFTTDGTTPVPDASLSPKFKAGYAEDYFVPKGLKIKGILPA
jgi:hypothetical protein